MEVLNQLIGRFHPLVVHLPIGILCLAAISEWLAVKPRWQHLRPAIVFMWGIGVISAMIACISGYLLAENGAYEQGALSWHQWTAISFAIYSLSVFILRKRKEFRYGRMVAVLTFIWMGLAGHFGGSLTHGTEFLLAPFEVKAEAKPRTALTDLDNALVYEDIIAPILRSKCTSCHGKSKQKGKLALHTPQSIRKGGKSGSDVLALVRSANNTILHRINLPLQEEEHMPPKDKAQLSVAEKQLVEWWLKENAPFDKKVKNLSPTDTLLSQLHYWNENIDAQNATAPVKNIAAQLPEVDLPKLDPEIWKEVQEKGILVLPVGKESPFVEVNFINVATFSDSLFASLTPLKKHIFRLKLSGQEIDDRHLPLIGQMSHLTRLYLDHTNISDEGLIALKDLKHLELLNLVGTGISEKGLVHLKHLPKLEHIYGFLTNFSPSDLLEQLPLDTGGYRVSTLATDTTFIPQN